jgi:hypothetical protein
MFTRSDRTAVAQYIPGPGTRAGSEKKREVTVSRQQGGAPARAEGRALLSLSAAACRPHLERKKAHKRFRRLPYSFRPLPAPVMTP